jgi:putative transposase
MSGLSSALRWHQSGPLPRSDRCTSSKAKYSKRYPEAVRSLAEDEEHLLTFYEFPSSMHRYIQTRIGYLGYPF